MFKDEIRGSLDIGSGAIKGLSLKKGIIEHVVFQRLGKGVFVSGEIEDSVNFLESLKSVVTQLNLKGKKVVVSIPAQDFFVKFFDIASDDESLRLDMINEELADLVPNYDPGEFVTEYVVLDSDVEKERIMAITIMKDKVEELLEFLKELRVKVVKIVPDFVSSFNFMEALKEEKLGVEPHENVMLVDIGAEATKIFIEKNGMIRMQRISPIGGNDFTEAIQRYNNLNGKLAEEYKTTLELRDKNTGDIAEDEEDMFAELGDLVEELEKQIQISIDFYKMQENQLGVDKLYLMGGASLLKGFKEHIESLVEIETDFLDYKYLDMDPLNLEKMNEVQVPQFANLLGNIVNEVR